jgi:hypothetical protein
MRTIDLSQLQKAEAGVTCGSLIFNHAAAGNRESLPPPPEATACQGIIEFGGLIEFQTGTIIGATKLAPVARTASEGCHLLDLAVVHPPFSLSSSHST